MNARPAEVEQTASSIEAGRDDASAMGTGREESPGVIDSGRQRPAPVDAPPDETSSSMNGGRPSVTRTVAQGASFAARLVRFGQRELEQARHDVKAVKERDPAAMSTVEIVTSYSGLHALWLHRLAHPLYQHRVPLVPRWISQASRFLTGIEIHPGAQIGESFFIDHGSGVVIGETTEVGDNVTLYQGVTLGGTGKETGKRHPTLGDNVVVGAGAQLLGSIKVGDNARIGAGSVVVHDVPRNSTVVGNPGHPVLHDGQRVGIPDIDYTHLPDPVAEAMRCLVRRIVELENELDDLYPERKEKRKAKTAIAEQRIEAYIGEFSGGAGI
jgi:serine O-acetyltransferase